MNSQKMKKNRIKSSNIKTIYAVLLLMTVLCSINGKNGAKNNNAHSEKTFMDNRKRKLADENYIIVKYNEDVQYRNGFFNQYRTNIDYIEYQNQRYSKDQELSISANTEIKIYILPDVTILESFFNSGVDSNGKKIISIDLSNFDSSSIINLNSLFTQCLSLKNINFLNFITSNVIDMANMFNGCSQLQSLDLSNFDTTKVSNMVSMFEKCSQLQSVMLSSFDTTSVTNMRRMFSGCSSLKSLDLSNFDTPLLESTYYMFNNCT